MASIYLASKFRTECNLFSLSLDLDFIYKHAILKGRFFALSMVGKVINERRSWIVVDCIPVAHRKKTASLKEETSLPAKSLSMGQSSPLSQSPYNSRKSGSNDRLRLRERFGLSGK